MREFAERYTAAWNSGVPDRVAEFFCEDGCLRVNDGEPAQGREAISALARGFMQAFPDLRLTCEGVLEESTQTTYLWTLRGTCAATGRKVQISGQELWALAEDGRVANSDGTFDAADYALQCGI